jgi:hypothetical protein
MASTVITGVSYLLCFFLTFSLAIAGDSDAANSAFMVDDSVHPLVSCQVISPKTCLPRIKIFFGFLLTIIL